MTRVPAVLGRGLLACWRFLVGDSPVDLVVAGAAVALAVALRTVHQAIWFVLPLLVVGSLVWTARRRARW